jgi:hypothetical protein
MSLAGVRWASEGVLIDIGLDLESAPPWQPRRVAGNPYHLSCEVDRTQLLQAADNRDSKIAPYPYR